MKRWARAVFAILAVGLGGFGLDCLAYTVLLSTHAVSFQVQNWIVIISPWFLVALYLAGAGHIPVRHWKTFNSARHLVVFTLLTAIVYIILSQLMPGPSAHGPSWVRQSLNSIILAMYFVTIHELAWLEYVKRRDRGELVHAERHQSN